MATRSLIAIKNPDDTYDAVYCHFDGYPKDPGVGYKLKKHYTSEEKIRELINGGAMSSLGAEVKDCEFYTKSGEELKVHRSKTLTELKKHAEKVWCEYVYTFNHSKWTHIEL